MSMRVVEDRATYSANEVDTIQLWLSVLKGLGRGLPYQFFIAVDYGGEIDVQSSVAGNLAARDEFKKVLEDTLRDLWQPNPFPEGIRAVVDNVKEKSDE